MKASFMMWLLQSRKTFKEKSRSSTLKAEARSVHKPSECLPLALNPSKRKYEIAIFACGCFWNPQRRFQKMEGVKRVVVGYTGGQQLFPTSKHLRDHTRALFIEYNPKQVSYLQLLQMWHENDYPWEPETLANRSAIFPTSERQLVQAHHFVWSLLALRAPYSELYVSIEPPTTFYQAEEYQQNYFLKQAREAKKHLIMWANEDVPSGLYPIVE